MTNFQIVMMVVQMVAILVLFLDLIYVARQKPSTLQSPLMVLLYSAIIMFIGYVIEIEGDCLSASLIGTAVAYIGKPYVMLGSYQFICAFYNKRIPRAVNYILSVICGLFFVIVYTNPYHKLYYATTYYERSRSFSPLILTRGPLYYLYVFGTVLFFLACIYELIRGTKRSAGRKVKYGRYILMMVVFGVLGYAVYLSGCTYDYDSTMLGIFLGVLCLSYMFLRYRIFDVLTLAKEQALEDSSAGLIVLDAGDNVVYCNRAVKELLKSDISLEQLMKIQCRNANISVNGRIYAITRKVLEDRDEYLGKALEITDITDTFNYQARLERDVKDRTDRIENIQRSIIMSIAGIVEARNMETGEHTRRTMELVHAIARELQASGKYPEILSDEYIEMLSSASSLHDIGKISVPDSVLLKPGALTEEEFEQIKKHTTAGAMVIEKAMSGLESPEYVSICKDVAHYHHEKWDGSGYPCGLIKTEIPLSARIMAVADVFDAVTGKRCYKETISHDRAVELIRNGAGSQFDPDVVEAFLKVLEKEEQN